MWLNIVKNGRKVVKSWFNRGKIVVKIVNLVQFLVISIKDLLTLSQSDIRNVPLSKTSHKKISKF